MKHSIALVTGATSGLGYAAARLLAARGYREVIVTGRSLAQIKETAAQLSGTVKVVTFGAAEYVWHPSGAASFADPDGPAKESTVEWKGGQTALLPKASITVLTGKVAGGM